MIYPLLKNWCGIIDKAALLERYMKRVLHTQTDWDNHELQLPDELPPPPERIRQKRSAKFTYYQNVCTVSYSSWSWSWPQWEAHIDWMALNGWVARFAPRWDEWGIDRLLLCV